jgi:hypothetical protein
MWLKIRVTLHVPLQCAFRSEKFAAKFAGEVLLLVLLQILKRREDKRAIFEGAFDVARNWRCERIDVALQEFSTLYILTVALVTLPVFRMCLCEGVNLFFREALHPHLQFPTSVDAAAQMTLQLYLGGKQFVANLAVLSILSFPVNSETGNLISVEKSGDFHAVLCLDHFLVRAHLIYFVINFN